MIIKDGVKGEINGIETSGHHHECYNGKGYPDGIFGREIPLSARIMAVADAYDPCQQTSIQNGLYS
ncbi:MAG TPA: HD domain-containing phosphohydrolase [Clostridia bacterium]|nr:HD domain-containing phosphohydrolase [Clostridia bacterium]